MEKENLIVNYILNLFNILRIQFNGRTSASQADSAGSIPVIRSNLKGEFFMFWCVLIVIGVVLGIIGIAFCFSCLKISSLESRWEEQLLRKMQEEQDKENTN